jgi:hypothetical protein
MASVRDIPSVPGELFAKFQTGFYADPSDAVFKALGVRWTPLSRPKNGDPSLHSHQALRALIHPHANAEASSPSERSRFSFIGIKATTNLVPLSSDHLALVALVRR